MKKLFLILTLILFPIILIGQTKLYKGVEIGKGGNVVTIDSIIQSSTFFKLYHGATELINIDTVTMLGPYINRADTSSMLGHYIERKDTSGMLTSYINRADTSTMLGHYIERKDTSSMLSHYITEVEADAAYAAIADKMAYPASGIALSTGSAWGTSITNNSTNWNTAYTDRLKWDGGSGGGVLVAATGRTSLGGTTVGQAFFTLTNPSAITFPRMNADNTVTALSASAFTTAIGAGHVASVTATLTAGALTDVTLTGVTTKPYHIMIQTTAGKDITSAVSDSLGISGGTYHLYVYSVDLITDAEIKVTH